RIRCREVVISSSALSVVWAKEIPSLALRVATFRPRIWVVNRLEIARPAASSLALLMRRPEDKRCREVCRAPWDLFRLRCALNDDTLVLIIWGMVVSCV